MKVCLATLEFPPSQWGGLARTARNVAHHVRDFGLEVHVAHFQVEPDKLVLLDENRRTHHIDGVTVHAISLGKEKLLGVDRELWDCPHTLTLQMMYQSLEKLHGELSFNLFHSFFLYPVGFVTGLLARRMNVPSVATIVGNDVKRYVFSPEKVAVCRSALENADVVVGLSRDLIEMADALAPIEHKARLIYNSVQVTDPAWAPRRASELRIGCAGIFKYAKGLPYLIKAASQIRSRHEISVELVGTVRESEKDVYRAIVERTAAEGVVHLREPLSHDEISSWLRTLDLFVLPSLTEGCPNILMEALASGVPCIATRTGAADRLVEDGVSGILIPCGDSGALADAIMRLIAHPELAESMGKVARRRMEEFSPVIEKKAWEEVYEGLLHAR